MKTSETYKTNIMVPTESRQNMNIYLDALPIL